MDITAGYQPLSQIAKWLQHTDTKCPFCDEEDTHAHRQLRCPHVQDVRHRHPDAVRALRTFDYKLHFPLPSYHPNIEPIERQCIFADILRMPLQHFSIYQKSMFLQMVCQKNITQKDQHGRWNQLQIALQDMPQLTREGSKQSQEQNLLQLSGLQLHCQLSFHIKSSMFTRTANRPSTYSPRYTSIRSHPFQGGSSGEGPTGLEGLAAKTQRHMSSPGWWFFRHVCLILGMIISHCFNWVDTTNQPRIFGPNLLNPQPLALRRIGNDLSLMMEPLPKKNRRWNSSKPPGRPGRVEVDRSVCLNTPTSPSDVVLGGSGDTHGFLKNLW